MDFETGVFVDAVKHEPLHIVARIAAVGVTHDEDGTFVVAGKNHVDELFHLVFSGKIVFFACLSVHVQDVDIHFKTGANAYCIVAEALVNQLVGSIARNTVSGFP